MGSWEGQLWEEGRVRVIGGDTGRGVLLRRRVRALWGVGLTGGKKTHSHLTSLLSFYGALCEQSNEVQITTQDC